ncbi:hypothetical protein AAY473_027710 [Plecturocebus cupreus]
MPKSTAAPQPSEQQLALRIPDSKRAPLHPCWLMKVLASPDTEAAKQVSCLHPLIGSGLKTVLVGRRITSMRRSQRPRARLQLLTGLSEAEKFGFLRPHSASSPASRPAFSSRRCDNWLAAAYKSSTAPGAGFALLPRLECSGEITTHCSLDLLDSGDVPSDKLESLSLPSSWNYREVSVNVYSTRNQEEVAAERSLLNMRVPRSPSLECNGTNTAHCSHKSMPPRCTNLKKKILETVSLCRPGWSAVVQSQLAATSTLQVQVILLPQPPNNLIPTWSSSGGGGRTSCRCSTSCWSRPTSPYIADEAPNVDVGQGLQYTCTQSEPYQITLPPLPYLCKQARPKRFNIYTSCFNEGIDLILLQQIKRQSIKT